MKYKFIVKDWNAKPIIDFHPLIIAYRKKNTVYMQNLDLPSGATVTYDEKTQELSLNFKLSEHEYVAIGQGSGIADKFEVKGKVNGT